MAAEYVTVGPEASRDLRRLSTRPWFKPGIARVRGAQVNDQLRRAKALRHQNCNESKGIADHIVAIGPEACGRLQIRGLAKSFRQAVFQKLASVSNTEHHRAFGT